MKKTNLQNKSVKELRGLAGTIGLKGVSGIRKVDLIHQILAAQKIKSSRKLAKKAVSESSRVASSPFTKSLVARTTGPKRAAGRQGHANGKREAPKAKTNGNSSPKPAESRVPERLPQPPAIAPAASSEFDNLGELPDAYGTGRLFLAARDPFWAYSYWDYTWQQMEDMRRQARNGELKLRIHSGKDFNAPIQQEITLNPSARNWFVHVGGPDADYCAAFGFYDREGRFVVTARSRPTHTPPNSPSWKTEARFVTIPFHISFRELFKMVAGHFRDGEELADVLYRLQSAGYPFPFTGEKLVLLEKPLEELFGKDLFRRIRMGSEEITQWMRKRLAEETSSGMFSPMGSSFGAPQSKGFWFKVNAELIIYGATEPDAKLVFDGREIPLKRDGTFRFQFALPDGSYHLPLSVISRDGEDKREVQLRVARQTTRQGDVGAVSHPAELAEPPKG